jgi:peptide deformylase
MKKHSHKPRILPIRLYGDPVLREQAITVTHFDESLHALANDMIATMYRNDGCGLAGPQIGSLLRIFTMDMGSHHAFEYAYDGKKLPRNMIFPITIINPEFITQSTDEDACDEGCLSLPGIQSPVSRPKFVKISFQDINGEHHSIEGNGVLAKCIQHEYDHLEGKLIIDYAPPSIKAQLRPTLKRIKQEQKQRMKALLKKESHA